MRRVLLGALVVGVIAWVVVDLLVVTDEERLAELSEAIVGELSPERVAAGLAWTDPSRVTVEVIAMGETRAFRDARGLREAALAALRPSFGTELRVLREAIAVTDADATVSLALVSDRGISHATFRLVDRDGRWLIRKVEVHR